MRSANAPLAETWPRRQDGGFHFWTKVGCNICGSKLVAIWTRVNTIRRSRPLGGHLLRSSSYQYSPDLRIVFFVKEVLEEGDDSEIGVEAVVA